MKAMIFAAGMGTRLKPFTDFKPKALAEINGITLLEHAVVKLLNCGIRDIIINVYHFSDQIISFLESKNNFNANITVSDESAELLDTGGGLLKALPLLGFHEPVLAYNVDVISDIVLDSLIENHRQSGAMATLAVRKRETSRYLLFDENYRLSGWENIQKGEKIIIHQNENDLKRLAFSGIQVIDPHLFQETSLTGKFSVIDLYLEQGIYNRIIGFVHNQGFWIDVGKTESLIEAEYLLNNMVDDK
jgi:NDP-sugar pyrophosphorylase family protein